MDPIHRGSVTGVKRVSLIAVIMGLLPLLTRALEAYKASEYSYTTRALVHITRRPIISVMDETCVCPICHL